MFTELTRIVPPTGPPVQSPDFGAQLGLHGDPGCWALEEHRAGGTVLGRLVGQVPRGPEAGPFSFLGLSFPACESEWRDEDRGVSVRPGVRPEGEADVGENAWAETRPHEGQSASSRGAGTSQQPAS